MFGSKRTREGKSCRREKLEKRSKRKEIKSCLRGLFSRFLLRCQVRFPLPATLGPGYLTPIHKSVKRVKRLLEEFAGICARWAHADPTQPTLPGEKKKKKLPLFFRYFLLFSFFPNHQSKKIELLCRKEVLMFRLYEHIWWVCTQFIWITRMLRFSYPAEGLGIWVFVASG